MRLGAARATVSILEVSGMKRRTRQAGGGTNGVIIIIVALAFATGLVLGALSSGPLQPPVIASKQESRSLQVGHEYYRAVNALLESGDEAALRGVLGDGFQSHYLSAAESGHVESLVAQLHAKASLHDDLVIVIEEIAASDHLVFATVRQVSSRSPVFAGIAMETEWSSPQNEVLKIEEGYVVGRWVDTPPEPVLATTASGYRISGIQNPELRRWQFDGHATLSLHFDSPMVLIANMGVLRVDVAGTEEGAALLYHAKPSGPGAFEPVALSGVEHFQHGDVIIVSTAAKLSVVNSTGLPASFLSIGRPLVDGERMLRRTGGSSIVRSDLMADGNPNDAWNGSTTVSIGWAQLPEGGSFSQTGQTEGRQFVVALDGGLMMRTTDGMVRSTASWGDLVESPELTVGTGRGAVIDSTGQVTFAPIQHRTCSFIVVRLMPAHN